MKTRMIALFCALFCLTGWVRAQEKIDPAFELIDPFLKENTYLVVHVDLKNLDFDAIAAKFKPQMLEGAETGIQFGAKFQGKENDEAFLAAARKEAEATIDAQIVMAKSIYRSIRDAGVENVFFLSMMETMQTFPVIMAIPGEPGFSSEVNDFIGLAFSKSGFADDMSFYVMKATSPMPMMLSGGAAMGMQGAAAPPSAPPEKLMDTLRRAKSKYREDINAALYLQRRSPIRVVLAPSLGMKMIGQMSAPAMLASVPGAEAVDQKELTTLIKDFESLSVGIDLVQMRFNIAAQFPSEESAEKAGKFFAGLAAGVEDEQLRIVVHEFLPKVNKKRLILVLQQEHFDKMQAMASTMMAAQMTAAMEETNTEENSDSESTSDSME